MHLGQVERVGQVAGGGVHDRLVQEDGGAGLGRASSRVERVGLPASCQVDEPLADEGDAAGARQVDRRAIDAHRDPLPRASPPGSPAVGQAQQPPGVERDRVRRAAGRGAEAGTDGDGPRRLRRSWAWRRGAADRVQAFLQEGGGGIADDEGLGASRHGSSPGSVFERERSEVGPGPREAGRTIVGNNGHTRAVRSEVLGSSRIESITTRRAVLRGRGDRQNVRDVVSLATAARGPRSPIGEVIDERLGGQFQELVQGRPRRDRPS